MTQDIAKIARGLTVAQRQAIKTAKDVQWLKGPAVSDAYHGNVTTALFRKGLTISRFAPTQLTPLGQQVLAYLLEQAK